MFLFFSCILLFASQEAETIGQKIYANECGGNRDKLVWWNSNEEFASVGIGHFIWYPKDKRGPFEETFPELLAELKKSGVDIPDWLNEYCPWNSKEEWMHQDKKRKELELLLSRTMAEQTQFIAKRFERAVDRILSTVSAEQKQQMEKKIERLSSTAKGKFALLDYHNFKGDGVPESERYSGQGWGLKQVLENMPDQADDPIVAFHDAAHSLLKQRVKNAPSERKEERWLPGWLARVDGYLKS